MPGESSDAEFGNAAMSTLSPLQLRLLPRILDFIEERRIAVGGRVSESELAQKLGVSRSPIRASMKLLLANELFKHSAGSGYTLARPVRAEDFSRFDTVGSDIVLYERLAEDIYKRRISGSFKEREILRRYQCGRSDLQKVLLRANREGIIARSPGRGWVIRPALDDSRVYYESYRLRIIIEPAALLEPLFSISPKLLDGLRRQHQTALGKHSLSGIELFEMNASFHETLAECSGNRYILEIIRHQNQLRRLSQYYRDRSAERVAVGCREHLTIMDALENGNNQTAAERMRYHLLESSKRFQVSG